MNFPATPKKRSDCGDTAEQPVEWLGWIASLTLVTAMAFSVPAAAGEPTRPVVVELFTSQGCPNCPAADAIVKKIAANPGFFPLSYHVTYFDKQGWKDPYATAANNARQKHYIHNLGVESVYTPQIVVDGSYSAIGSNSKDVATALTTARASKTVFPLSITPNAAGGGLDVKVGDNRKPPADAALYEVHFNRKALTPVNAGENSGMTVENVNNVVAFFPVPLATQYYIPTNSFAEDGIAYLLQDSKGHMLGAAYYVKQ
jgi:hypothetical protein